MSSLAKLGFHMGGFSGNFTNSLHGCLSVSGGCGSKSVVGLSYGAGSMTVKRASTLRRGGQSARAKGL